MTAKAKTAPPASQVRFGNGDRFPSGESYDEKMSPAAAGSETADCRPPPIIVGKNNTSFDTCGRGRRAGWAFRAGAGRSQVTLIGRLRAVTAVISSFSI